MKALDYFKRFSVFQITLAISVAVHASLLTVRLVNPEGFNRFFENAPLEVILVNAHTNAKVTNAQAIAQANLEGGGEHKNKDVRASTPLPASALSKEGDSAQDESAQLQTMQSQQTVLLAHVKSQLAAMEKPEEGQLGDIVQQKSHEEKRRRLLALLGEIEKRINEENARPKKRYISPTTKEAFFAIYYDKIKRRIEETGTDNFPTENGNKLYGNLMMEINVLSNGQVSSTQILQSSGNPVLDSQARAIVRASSGFGKFPADMRDKADVIAVVTHFKFSRDDTLETKIEQ